MDNVGNKKNEFLEGALLKSKKYLNQDQDQSKDSFINEYKNSLGNYQVIHTTGGGQFKKTKSLKGNISGLHLCTLINEDKNNRLKNKPNDTLVSNGRSWKHTEVFGSPKLTRRPLHPEATNRNEEKQLSEMEPSQNGKAEKLYVCHNCGGLSKDSSYCDWCHRALPKDAKPYYKEVEEKKQMEGNILKQSFYGKRLQDCKYPSRGARTTDGSNRGSIIRRSAASRYCRKLDRIEPECLTISSDDESDFGDNSPGNSQESNSQVSSLQNSQETCIHPVISNDLKEGIPLEKSEYKEMFPMNSSENSTDGNTENHTPPRKHRKIIGPENSSFDQTEVSIKCRSIRIGSHKIIPQTPIKITHLGIFFESSTVAAENDILNIHVSTADIIRILISFNKNLTVFFLYTTPGFAGKIRSRLHMMDKTGPYYDPGSSDETQKRITVLPEKITDHQRVMITGILKNYSGEDNEMMKEIDVKSANEILVKSTPDEFPMSVIQSPSIKITKLMTYPPPPQTGGITITTDDYSCLEEGQFLNDVIIDFYLKYLVQNKLSEENRKRTHIFSSFFYRRLTQRPLRKHSQIEDPKLSPAENRHNRVKTWTRHVDIFEKDFIIIPINEHAHWFLAVVCFPYLDGPIPFSADTKELKEKLNLLSREKSNEATNLSSVSISDGTEEMKNEESMDTDDVENEEMQSSTFLEEDDAREPENNTPYPIKQPCILIFDSLLGPNRGRIIATLREYLKIEWKVKKKTEKTFDKDVLKGNAPKVPQQRNYSDCGIYLLQYVESFFENPIQDYTIPIRSLKEWFTDDEVNKKRDQLRNLIYKLMLQQHGKSLLPEDSTKSCRSQELINQLVDNKNEMISENDSQS